MYVRFRNYILIYETFFNLIRFSHTLSFSSTQFPLGVAEICWKASLERKANESGLKRAGWGWTSEQWKQKRKARTKKRKTKNTHK